MDHLSGLDAAFLHLESPETPMHIGGLSIMELPPEYTGDFMDDVRNHIQNRMHMAPIFQRKLINMPFDIANPIWVMDESIDIDYHIRHVIVPPPATRVNVDKLVARLHSSLLDRSRPLWEMHILDGLPVPEELPKGTRYVGLYSKMHHAALDGMGGQVLMEAIMDVSAVPRAANKRKRRRESIRGDHYGIAELTASGVMHNVSQSIKLTKNLPKLTLKAFDMLKPAKAPDGDSSERLNWFAPKTPLNATITNQRSFARFSIPYADVKKVAKLNGVSLNDVVMSISGEGMLRYFADEVFVPIEPLLAAIPVSVRPEGNTELSNQVSIARMSLATNIEDPLERLQAIKASSNHTKSLMSDVKAIMPTDFPSIGAPWLMSSLASTLTRTRVVNAVPPFANVLISNVPGPNITLYFAGAKQISTYPVSIPYHGMGLNITLQSYNGWLDFGLISCQKLMPDIHELAQHMKDALQELLAISEKTFAAPLSEKEAEATTNQ
ncbi:WS/DGAT/MGAT family O-acyltransferase [Paraglaciecola arctica]|uniref:WS/DGAT/MGAT family O-acyltransferase n=1 Tax=Paraglaciecola arctica TaxID=1128911 RepID=UPI001C07E3F9|nr:wax ester/triacylglycerol synthase family O-acyltransferase [Paraglaciecola arctica]MBU3004594.1 wax ester/triacylglycerol synthase family O-acyltransferase [Paraglaciecola arctica]